MAQVASLAAPPSPRLPDQVVQGLLRAVAAEGCPLLGSGKTTALFPHSRLGKQAAQFCLDQGLLQVVGIETRGNKTQELYALTPQGLEYLLKQKDARAVLERLASVVQQRTQQVEALLAGVLDCQQTLHALQQQIAGVLQNLPDPSETLAALLSGSWKGAVLEHLQRWHSDRPNEDCPLPELYAVARRACPRLSLGQFHDGLRAWHEAGEIYLHPWTGPLYEIPEPACALLIGHAVAYYASAKDRP